MQLCLTENSNVRQGTARVSHLTLVLGVAKNSGTSARQLILAKFVERAVVRQQEATRNVEEIPPRGTGWRETNGDSKYGAVVVAKIEKFSSAAYLPD